MLDDNQKPEKTAEAEAWKQSLDEVAARELLLLGEGQLVYFRPVSGEEYAAVVPSAKTVSGLGVFSARGNLLAVCPDLVTAAAYAMDNELMPVRLH